MTDFIKLHKISLITAVLSLATGLIIFFSAPTVIEIFSRGTESGPLTEEENSFLTYNSISNVRIKSISDDERNYYVSYTYTTENGGDSTSTDTDFEQTLTASKDSVNEAGLGLYVANQLKTKFANADEYDIRLQVEQVLATPNWEAPIPTSGNEGEFFIPNSGSPSSQGSSPSPSPTPGTPNGSPTAPPIIEGTPPPPPSPESPPEETPSAQTPPEETYYPPYNGPPIPDVNNEDSDVPVPE